MNDQTPSGTAPGRLLLPALIAAQAARTPEAPALRAADGSVRSYAELAEQAGRVAASLRARGVGPGDIVGVCLRRGPGLPAALLGVWWAGAAYLPLDPAHPADRLALQLEDCDQPLVLAEAATEAALPDFTATLRLDADAGTAAGPFVPGEVPFDPEAPAYVLHTSGSTGRPKGVLVPHRGIANRVRWLVHKHRLGAADRMLLKTTVGFDAAGLELFAPLVAGGTLVLAPEGAERDPAALLRAAADAEVTVLQAVPSVYRRLVEEPGWNRLHALRLLFSAGEPLHAELCRRLAAAVPGVEIWNTYGPTEASVDVTEHRFDAEVDSGAVPIGRPLGGTQVLLLDQAGRPVPVGVPGELHVGGAGLALGYLGRPGLTAERFVPHPVTPGARLYRTGDRARWRADGALEYLGRLDQQVKVNGVRIEPGEVEAALVAHPWVREAVVGAVPTADGGYRLAAWVQSRGEAPRPDELRAFLRRALPEPLLPTVYVPVSAWPLTASGKIDRGALPNPSTAAPAEALVPVRTAAERLVAEQWSELLGTPVDEIGANSDFFQLGGSSLQLTRLAVRLTEALGTVVPVRRLLLASTVAAQAALRESAAEAGADAAPTALLPVHRRAEGLPLAPGQQGLWLADRLRPGSAEWTAPVFVRLPADLDDDAVYAALEELADRHEILRTRYLLRGAEPVQLADVTGPWQIATATVTDPEQRSRVIAAELARPFDLEHGPVWRALLVREARALTVVLSVHHIACDGWSSVVLERDLRALAEAAATGVPAVLPELPVQYADHAVHLRRRLSEPAIEAELAYWRRALDGLPTVDLPTDRPRPDLRDAAGAAHLFTVPAPVAEALATLGRSWGATLPETLLAAFAALVGRLTGHWDLPIGIPVAGRDQDEVADVVGFFLNTLVLRCDAPAESTFRDAVALVRDRSREARTHADLPFHRLVEELGGGRDLGRTPLYQVMFDVHEEGRTGTVTGAEDLEAFRSGWRVARTDLTVVLQRQEDGSLLGMAEYATALFDAATVERLADCWLRLLESLATRPFARLDEAELLPERLRTRILAQGLGLPEPGAGLRAVTGVEAVVAETAAVAPEDTAVVCAVESGAAGNGAVESWSYRRLLRRAAAVAARLRGLGAGPETRVALLLPRTPDLIATVLGCWQAGAAYVPLDPAAPDERLAYVVADAGATVLVSDGAGADRLARAVAAAMPDRAPLAVLALDTDAELAAAPEADPAAERHDPARLAYVMYTSGSTGRPKGVEVEHRTLLRMLRAAQAHLDFGVGPDDAWLALAQPTFDISCTELFMPLVAGGRVVLAGEQDQNDHRAQLRLIDRHEVTHLQVAPAHWQMLIDAGLGRRVLVGQTGGEPCPPSLARELSRRLQRFVNEYGLTETTIAATRWEASDAAVTVPVGSPYPHVTARVLDAWLRPVPYGVVGELCVGGVGLARGYHGRADLTAAAFVPDPYGAPGTRLYRTGDLARQRPDGALEFVGRQGGHVKIRGRRVDPGEVQGVLVEHPAVAQAVVVVQGTGPEAALVGYWVGDGHGTTEAQLLDHCAAKLADYMVPALLVHLDELPLNRHNKVDTAALPVPDLTAALGDEPYTEPEGPVEEALAEIWAEVLHGEPAQAPRIGARQGFFRIGGNSVRAARVVARIQEEFDVELPLRAVFEHPTVARLAEAVEEALRAELEALHLVTAPTADAVVSREYSS
ncbi:amino acid adenylation domain-containing protein [Streptacidiphilus sp. MAP12-33]|uniref:amino acid adenylation domain-containing protein n=1 Tax=Streptacidiphilus sp. MAP12-33 TaxID=3156266 RepID=UPI003512739F